MARSSAQPCQPTLDAQALATRITMCPSASTCGAPPWFFWARSRHLEMVVSLASVSEPNFHRCVRL
eukprot:4802546-Amphidinium_carterae.1